MSNIFKKHYESFSKKILLNNVPMERVSGEIKKIIKYRDFTDGAFLYRFPKKELRYFLRLECPTERAPEIPGVKNYDIIKAAKRLRYYMGIPEHAACSKCSKRETCKFKDILPPKKETSLGDLLIVVNGLYDYKVSLAPNSQADKDENDEEHDPSKISSEIDEDDQENEDDSDKDGDDKSENENLEEFDDEEEAANRYNFKMWLSAVNIVDTLHPVVLDAKLRKGNGIRQFIRAYVSARNLNKEEKGQIDENFSDEEEIEAIDERQKSKNQNKLIEEDLDEDSSIKGRRATRIKSNLRKKLEELKSSEIKGNNEDESFDVDENFNSRRKNEEPRENNRENKYKKRDFAEHEKRDYIPRSDKSFEKRDYSNNYERSQEKKDYSNKYERSQEKKDYSNKIERSQEKRDFNSKSDRYPRGEYKKRDDDFDHSKKQRQSKMEDQSWGSKVDRASDKKYNSKKDEYYRVKNEGKSRERNEERENNISRYVEKSTNKQFSKTYPDSDKNYSKERKRNDNEDKPRDMSKFLHEVKLPK